ncbi:unannotated protein [freshwater metagenome]|uniref:Unannotated protein n=2 Tax=freshwater metagenome TaxID=449393 RepID=A0A6J6NIF8_9ZZZZ
MLEAGEHPAGISRLELRVEVSLVIDWIHESMEALTGVHVRAVGGDNHLIFRQQIRQIDAVTVKDLGDVQVGSV